VKAKGKQNKIAKVMKVKGKLLRRCKWKGKKVGKKDIRKSNR
jgi:hypothetical protein